MRSLLHADSSPVTQAEIEFEIIRLCVELEDVQKRMEDQGQLLGRAEVRYKRERATARLRSDKKSGEDREAEAVVLSIAAFEEFRMAQAIMSSMTDRSFTIRAQLEALRTISANLRGLVS